MGTLHVSLPLSSLDPNCQTIIRELFDSLPSKAPRQCDPASMRRPIPGQPSNLPPKSRPVNPFHPTAAPQGQPTMITEADPPVKTSPETFAALLLRPDQDRIEIRTLPVSDYKPAAALNLHHLPTPPAIDEGGRKCIPPGRRCQAFPRTPGSEKKNPATRLGRGGSGVSDRDRTGDLQSHNLAL
jgi:hypothetical protein